jgi:hypothetical protein
LDYDQYALLISGTAYTVGFVGLNGLCLLSEVCAFINQLLAIKLANVMQKAYLQRRPA